MGNRVEVRPMQSRVKEVPSTLRTAFFVPAKSRVKGTCNRAYSARSHKGEVPERFNGPDWGSGTVYAHRRGFKSRPPLCAIERKGRLHCCVPLPESQGRDTIPNSKYALQPIRDNSLRGSSQRVNGLAPCFVHSFASDGTAATHVRLDWTASRRSCGTAQPLYCAPQLRMY